ncbi:GDP-fucose protein O-fucosyltransferase 2 [Halyomorpha halys]|uniref:GDP-fucose protein O-fucosyltransferase 2 n=1 Tax=Halyomorpha halys TaxID=286706 RepID=UPI0006D4E1F5|nr:GDP-fucose protein O-fucosyltransferase 2 [Halyomorpha halys]
MIINLQNILVSLVFLVELSIQTNEFCSVEDKICSSSKISNSNTRYILYDVNYSEGFNLRRDVYMRMAIFMHLVQHNWQHDWHLVLPPWPRLYHWQSRDVENQNFLPWSSFFDIKSLKRFSPVMEYTEFLKESKSNEIDEIYVLQHFERAFKDKNWNWDDKWSFVNCDKEVLCLEENCKLSAYMLKEEMYYREHWSYENMTSRSLRCVSFQGPASFLKNIFKENHNSKRILIDHAEIVVHDGFGDQLYWKCRRSMRFAKNLVQEADQFRTKYLGCNDIKDNTERPLYWENEKNQRKAVGGPFVCAHLRRGDFVYSRGNQLPSLKFAAKQLVELLTSLKLNTIYLATDGSPEDVEVLKQNLKDVKLMQYIPDPEVKRNIKDGGVAIIDQIICSYARYFIGTHESTFTFRIQEEREIMGFPINTTFNVFCASPKKCFETSKWMIVY